MSKERFLKPRRVIQELRLPEFDAPLLVVEMSGLVALRLRERKLAPDSEAALTAMVAAMIVDDDGSRLFSSDDEATTFLEGLSLASITTLLRACTSMQSPGGDPGNSKPSTSAA
jgi:hypothetical protein